MPSSNSVARVAAVFLLLPLGIAIAACERSESADQSGASATHSDGCATGEENCC